MARAFGEVKPWWFQALIAGSALVLFVSIYIVVMHLTVAETTVDANTSVNDRDTFYFLAHVSLLAFAAAAGLAIGRWLSGMMIAYSTLFVVVLALVMLVLQLGSYRLACEGHNDLLRHWTCSSDTAG